MASHTSQRDSLQYSSKLGQDMIADRQHRIRIGW